MKKLPSVAQLLAATTAGNLPEAVDLSGWNSDHPLFDRLVVETQPTVIVEVGSWKGRSTHHLALASANLKEIDEVSGADIPKNTHIYSVDTWLGGIDHMLSDKPQDDVLRDACGSPRLYHQFIRNFADAPDFARRVFPIQNTSLVGAKILAHLRVKADLIYIDASHEYADVYADLCAYENILRDGGVMFGDDFRNFPGVFAAVLRFSHESCRKIEEVDHNFWVLR